MIYLYVKQHSVTGLKYFGKTTKKNPFKYLGSGKYWMSHIIKHGIEFTETIELYSFDSQELCSKFALKFSTDNNIVESEEWANLILEDGVRGGSKLGRIFSSEHKENISRCKTNKVSSYNIKTGECKLVDKELFNNSPDLVGINKNRTFDSTNRKGISAPNFTGFKHTDESKTKTSKSMKEYYSKLESITCPHCGLIGRGSSMKRYHLDNCKHK